MCGPRTTRCQLFSPRLAALVEQAGFYPAAIPLESYRSRKLYVMRTDAYDRFCTRLEQRFTRPQIAAMLRDAGFDDIRFSDSVPYCCAIGRKRELQPRHGCGGIMGQPINP